MKALHLIFCIFFILVACADEQQEEMSIEPSNLEIQADINEDRSGMISVRASGNNVTEYHFEMGDRSDVIINETGSLSYTYATTGTYIIEVKAYGNSGRFIQKSKQVLIILKEDVELSNGYTTPISYADMNLLWNDEFDGLELNENKWTHEIGDGCPGLCGWGNKELQYYRRQNSDVVDGVLRIEAREEGFQDRDYTSSRIITKNKFDFQYGRVDVRARLPQGQGIWPAIWMLGANIDQVGWPRCGEIDIMEMVGGANREKTIHGTAHWYSNEKTQAGASFTLPDGQFSDAFHVFSLLWEEDEICWLVDDQKYYSLNISDPTRSEFQQEFFLIMNIAVGGLWPGSPDNSTLFPTNMYIDYVRVFQNI